MLHVYHSPTHLFSHIHFSHSSLCQLEWLPQLQQSPVPLQFPLPDMVIATDATPTHCTFHFQGSNRQHRSVCAKTISSWVRKVLCVAKAHMSPISLQGAAASASLAAGVSLVFILQAGDWTRGSIPAGHYFSPYITTVD